MLGNVIETLKYKNNLPALHSASVTSYIRMYNSFSFGEIFIECRSGIYHS